MTTAELKQIIGEVVEEKVTEAIRKELRGILTEAVEIASRPQVQEPVDRAAVSMPGLRPSYDPVPTTPSADPLAALLHETRRGMSQSDYAAVMGGGSSPVVMSEMPRLHADDGGVVEEAYVPESGIPLPDFAKNAAAIFEAAQAKKS